MAKTILHARPRRMRPRAATGRWAAHHRRLLELRLRVEAAPLRDLASWMGVDRAGPADDVLDFGFELLQREADPCGEIHAALERIAAGVYGICGRTGRPINPARLRAVPWLRCIDQPACGPGAARPGHQQA